MCEIFFKLQAQANPRPGVKHQAAEARAAVIFLLTSWNIPYKRSYERTKNDKI